MPGTNQFLPFAVGGSANTLTPTAYASLTTLLANGFQSGVAPSAQFNTALRQATTVAAGVAQFIANQGPNVNDDGNAVAFAAQLAAATSGRLLAVRLFTTANNGQAYTPTAGTTSVIVEAVGSGGAGGGTVVNSSGQISVGSGGSAGAYARSRFTSGFSGAVMTIPAGGAGISGANGSNGATTSFGALLSCPGGNGGAFGGAASNTSYGFGSYATPAAPPSGANIASNTGSPGTFPIYMPGGFQSGSGGSSPLGSGGAAQLGTNPGVAGAGYGSGGSGASSANAAAQVGGAGAPGCIIVWEYA